MGCASVKSAALDIHEEIVEYSSYDEQVLAPYEEKVISLLLAMEASQTIAEDRDRTIIFFDWDDTLCPLTWANEMRSASGEKMSLSEVRTARAEELKQLAMRVVEVLTVAQRLGTVVLVTNAVRPLPKLTCAKLMPQASAMLKKIPIVYANEHVSEVGKPNPSATDALIEGKTRAMKAAVSEFISPSKSKAWANIVSIGNSRCDLGEIREVASETCRTKAIKMREDPSPDSMMLQQTVVSRWLSHIVYAGVDVDIDFGTGSGDMHSA